MEVDIIIPPAESCYSLERKERGSEEMRTKKRRDGKVEEKKKQKRSRGSA